MRRARAPARAIVVVEDDAGARALRKFGPQTCCARGRVTMLRTPDQEVRFMSAITDVESAASWRSYKNNRYASLGARRILRVLRQHFRTHRHVMRREDDFRQYAWSLFEELNDAGAFALMHCGVAEENERATEERENRRRRAKGQPLQATPEAHEAELAKHEQMHALLQRQAAVEDEQRQVTERRERRRMQLAMPGNAGRISTRKQQLVEAVDPLTATQ